MSNIPSHNLMIAPLDHTSYGSPMPLQKDSNSTAVDGTRQPQPSLLHPYPFDIGWWKINTDAAWRGPKAFVAGVTYKHRA
ncbi:hypothetical protein CDL15_Pgr018398 [Punica granatum]|uniref:Uncharacterized protein n=1 Tax=Punica granatum TaxID=22663 RepID=A0A218W301_PUNGR|nr:hypothetical protein CDL15_Pgr018398 [Punica granatum]